MTSFANASLSSPGPLSLTALQCTRRLPLLAGTIALLGVGLTGPAQAQDQLLWGDLHLHTNLSTDAFATGNKGVTPDMAYRFARGIPIHHPDLDTKVSIDRPLDFLAITDHAINLGIDVMIKSEHELLRATEWGRELIAQGGGEQDWAGFMRFQAPPGEAGAVREQVFSPQMRAAGWQMQVDAAEHHNRPGEFTTLFAWEWTSLVPSDAGVKNLHRNIISNANTVEDAASFLPFSNADSLDPEDLWAFLRDTHDRTGIDFVSIPHNSNISGGLMFPEVDSDGRPIDARHARERMRWELLVEITQMKGTSEVHPALAPTDEFADFEIRRKLLAGQPTPPDESDYVRSALLRGMAFNQRIGENPYKLGFVGGTDGHMGMSSAEEQNFMGKLAADAQLSERAESVGSLVFPAWEMSASGLTGVWAEENSREAIFQAFKRKEVYGTTGPRIRLRVFGGFNFRPQDITAVDIAATGYRKGVPMGSDLTAAPEGQAPSLLIQAVKDPTGANLDRVQVVKGWVDEDGVTRQQVYDVAWSGDREPDAEGRLPPVGNTVDISSGRYENSIGSTELVTVWHDPDFDPALDAFYYVRVLEIPTPRHSLLDALALGIPVEETGQPATLQERAYASPIWYTP